MIRIVAPDPERVAALQDGEGSYYWSACAETFLRQHGVISVLERGDDSTTGSIDLILRGADAPESDRPAFFEGPLAAEVLARLGIDGDERVADPIVLERPDRRGDGSPDPTEAATWNLAFQRFTVRRIPLEMGETSDPYLFESTDPLYHDGAVRYQVFREAEGWRPNLYAFDSESGERQIVGMTDGVRQVTGIPFFDLMCFDLASPPTGHGFYASLNSISRNPVRDYLLRELDEIARAAGVDLVRVASWPEGKRCAFTVRHDYDRYITQRELDWLLDQYARRSVRCSWYTLAARAPSEQLRRLAAAGHEVALHTEANDEDAFREEVARVGGELGARLSGMTAHGGLGSPGFIGDTQYAWAEAAGLQFGEILGRATPMPHRVLHTRNGRPEESTFYVPGTHTGLEASTQDAEVDIQAVAACCRQILDEGGQLNLMNHPDIFRPELIAVIDELDLSGCWSATHREIVDWTAVAKYESRVVEDGDGRWVVFDRPLPEPTLLFVGEASVRAERGATRVRIDGT